MKSISLLSRNTVLSLARNILQNVGSDDLYGLKQTCKHLDLSNNSISQVHPRAFSFLKNLEYFDLSDNNVTNVRLSPNMPRLRVLLLGGNRLQTFPGQLRLFLSISRFNVSHNSIPDLPSLSIFGNSKDRTVLADFQQNSLRSVGDLHLIGSFGRIDFSSNNLTNLAPTALIRVKYARELDLSKNKIRAVSSTIDHAAFTVTSLDMSRNGLILWLKNALATEDKQCGTILTTLDLSYNNLGRFRPGQIASLSSSLAVLDIRNNTFESLPESDFSNMTKLTHLFLAGNPWYCNCGLVWIRQLEHVLIDNATCLVPHETYGDLVVCYKPPESCQLDQPTNDSRCQITPTSSIMTTPATTSSRVQTSSEALNLTIVPSVSASSTTHRGLTSESPFINTTAKTSTSMITTAAPSPDVTASKTSVILSTLSSLSPPSSVSETRTESATPSTAANATVPSTSVSRPDISTPSASRLPVSSTAVTPVNVTTTARPVSPSATASSTSASATASTIYSSPASRTMSTNTTVRTTSAESSSSSAVPGVTSTSTTRRTTPGLPVLSSTTTPTPPTRSSTVTETPANVTSTSGKAVTSRRTPGPPTKPSTTPGLPLPLRTTPGLHDAELLAGPLQQVSSLDLNKTDQILVAAALGIAAFLILAAIVVGLVICLCWRSA